MRVTLNLLLVLLMGGCAEIGLSSSDSQVAADKNLHADFQVLPYGDGIVRLNARTGQLLLIRDSEIAVVDQDNFVLDPRTLREQETVSLAAVKEYSGAFPMSKNCFWYGLTYKWRDETLHYRYRFGPYVEELNKAIYERTPTVNVPFTDADGFTIVEATINLNQATRLYGSDGVKEWVVEGKVPCTRENYSQISTTSTGWNFDEEFDKALLAALPKGRELVGQQFDILADLFSKGHLKGQASRLGDDLYFVATLQEDGNLKSIEMANWSFLAQIGYVRSLSADQQQVSPETAVHESEQPASSAPASASPISNSVESTEVAH